MSDPAFTCHFLDAAAFRAADDLRMEFAKRRVDGKKGASLHEVVKPCAMWFSDWYFDPKDPADKYQRDKALAEIAAGTFEQPANKSRWYLSSHYWKDWSAKRPPISVLCPSGSEWCIDAVSSNGTGWTVTGDVPKITATPSIVVPGYHGFLKDGVFTPNM